MVISYVSTRRDGRDISGVYASSYITCVVFVFSHNDAFAHAMIDVGPLQDQSVLSLDKDQRICDQYGGCAITFHECLFSLVGYGLPFNGFEISVLNHLLIAPLQLHPMNWAFVKVFQYLYEYKGIKLRMTLFFTSLECKLVLNLQMVPA